MFQSSIQCHEAPPAAAGGDSLQKLEGMTLLFCDLNLRKQNRRVQKLRLFLRQVCNAFAVELNHFPRARPNAFFAVRASFIDNRNARFHQLNGIFGAHANAATAKIAFARHNVDHEWSRSRHIRLLHDD